MSQAAPMLSFRSATRTTTADSTFTGRTAHRSGSSIPVTCPALQWSEKPRSGLLSTSARLRLQATLSPLFLILHNRFDQTPLFADPAGKCPWTQSQRQSLLFSPPQCLVLHLLETTRYLHPSEGVLASAHTTVDAVSEGVLASMPMPLAHTTVDLGPAEVPAPMPQTLQWWPAVRRPCSPTFCQTRCPGCLQDLPTRDPRALRTPFWCV